MRMKITEEHILQKGEWIWQRDKRKTKEN
jgi:hypothetical protein